MNVQNSARGGEGQKITSLSLLFAFGFCEEFFLRCSWVRQIWFKSTQNDVKRELGIATKKRTTMIGVQEIGFGPRNGRNWGNFVRKVVPKWSNVIFLVAIKVVIRFIALCLTPC